jgi:hypothetical protein
MQISVDVDENTVALHFIDEEEFCFDVLAELARLIKYRQDFGDVANSLSLFGERGHSLSESHKTILPFARELVAALENFEGAQS